MNILSECIPCAQRVTAVYGSVDLEKRSRIRQRLRGIFRLLLLISETMILSSLCHFFHRFDTDLQLSCP